MDRFQAYRVSVQVAQSGSFVQAALALNMSAPAVTRAVSSLEAHLGARLFVRTTRSVQLSEEGAVFIAQAKRILNELDQAEGALKGELNSPKGSLCLSAPVLFGRLYLAPLLGPFLESYPELNLDVQLLDRVVDMREEGIDIALRIGHLPDSSLHAVRVGEVKRVTVAHQSYFKDRSRPQTPRDLKDHILIHPSSGTDLKRWRFYQKGRVHSIALTPRISLNTNDAVISVVQSGLGITQLLSYQVAPFIKDGSLEALLTEYEEPCLPIHIVHLGGQWTSSKVRCAVDYLVEQLRKDRFLNP